jgi:hypothetical protein
MAGTIGQSSYDSWNFQKYRVQQGVAGGQFINAESTLIAAGPPTITVGPTTNTDVFPIGLLETFGLQQSRQLQRIFEIGSSRSYFIPGRTIGSVTLGRTFYHGVNLLRALYAYYNGSAGNEQVSTLLKSAPAVEAGPGTSTSWREPGYGDFFIDLASALFAQPTGLACYFKDANTDTYGGFYLENCYVQGHQMTVSSGSVLIMEGASLQYDLLVPLKISAAAADTGLMPSTSATQAADAGVDVA